MRLAASPRLHAVLLHTARHALLLMCVGAVVVALWASRSMAALDVMSNHPAFKPIDHGLVESIRDAENLQGLKKVCTILAAHAEKLDAAERRDNAMALTMINSHYTSARGFSAVSAIVLLVAWVAAGAVLCAARAPSAAPPP